MSDEIPLKIKKQVEKGITILRKGGVIAFPTDTVFAIGAGIYDEKGIQQVFEIKKRPRSRTLPVLLADASQIHEVAAEIPAYAWKLIDCFWPGALTLIVFRSRIIKDIITNGGDTLAVRMPDHPVPRALMKGCGCPLIGTSANISGHIPSVSAGEVLTQFKDSLGLVIEGIPAPRGTQSTILDVTGELPVIIREGYIPRTVIEEVVGKF